MRTFWEASLVRRSQFPLLLALTLLGTAGLSQSSWALQPEILGQPKETLAQAPKDKADSAKDSKDDKKDEKKDMTPLYKAEPEPAAETATAKALKEVKTTADKAIVSGDTAWMLTSSALVLLMVPGLALFYAGMVRRKNVLATMMQSFAALAVVGVYWIAVGYSLAFGPSVLKVPDMWGVSGGGFVGWSWKLFFLQGIGAGDSLPGYNITVYAHVMFQGMFAIITPALISGAIAERIRFWPFCIFMILWVTLVYCPLAHMVWAFDWFYDVSAATSLTDGALPAIGATATGFLGKLGAWDFAGGTVVHIAAGTAGLACALVLRRRNGYPGHTGHPNSMVLTLVGAGLLWFGWFGFNGGSGLGSGGLSTSAFAATQAAAAAAGLSWVLTEWLVKGKPTALGLASGIVAGLVAVTPASGYVYVWGGLAIGAIAGVVCYGAVLLKPLLGYDDSLDAFGVHAIGGFLGAVLTGVFCYSAVLGLPGADGYFAMKGIMARPAAIEKETTELKSELPKLSEAVDKADKAVEEFKAKNPEPAETDKEKKKEYDASLGELEVAAAKAKFLYRATLTSIGKQQGVAAIDPKFIDPIKNAVAELEAMKKKADEDLDKKKAELDGKVTPEKAAEELAAVRTAATDADKAYSDENGFYTGLDVGADDQELAVATKAVADMKDADRTPMTQFWIQLKAAAFSMVYAFVLSLILAFAVQAMTLGNFSTSKKDEVIGLDQTEHGESGFDFGSGYDGVPTTDSAEPKAAKVPPGQKRFEVVLEGIDNGELMKAWSALCQPSDQPIDPDFKAIYPYVTTVQGNRFRLRGGDSAKLSASIQKLFSKKLGKQLKVRVEE